MPTPVLAVLFALLPCPQDPGTVLATYRRLGQPASVTRDDVALEMAFHQRRKEEGRRAATHLADTSLIRLEAERRKLLPTEAEAQSFWLELQKQLRAAGEDPSRLAVVRNTDQKELLADLALQIAHERLVRATLELKPAEPVNPEMLRLWLLDARKRHQVVEDPEQLPLGAAVRVDDREVPVLELGRLLLRRSEPDEQEYFVRQVVVIETLDAMAREQGIAVGEPELRAEVAARAEAARKDPRYQGMSYEQLLKAQGVDVEWMLRSRVFRAQLLQRLLVERQHPDAEVRAEIGRDRPAALAEVGSRRQLAVIFARAQEQPSPLVPRDFAAATAALQKVQERLQKGEAFDYLARVESDDPTSKQRGGDLGWQSRRGGPLPEPVAAAAFAAAAGAVVGPVAATDGVYLVKVLAIEPEPGDEELVRRWRERRIDELTRKILADAAIQLAAKEAGK